MVGSELRPSCTILGSGCSRTAMRLRAEQSQLFKLGNVLVPASESLTREECPYSDSTTANRPQGARPIRRRSRAAPGLEFPSKGVGLSTAGLSDNTTRGLPCSPSGAAALSTWERPSICSWQGLPVKSTLLPALGRETKEHSLSLGLVE